MKPLRALKQAAAVAPLAMKGRKGGSRQVLAERLAPLKGASTKIAQLLTARDGEDAGETLEPLPLDQLLPIVHAAAPGLLTEGSRVEPLGRRASLAQVHRAHLEDGREVALKILLPGVGDDLRSDLSVVGWVGRRASRRLNERFDGVGVDEWIAALGDELIGELDYRSEGEIQVRYREAVAAFDGVLVPELVLAEDEVLVSAWEGGSSLADAMGWEAALRARLGASLARAVLAPMLSEGLVHGDLHPGNVAFRREGGGEVVLYDFGATRQVNPAAREAWNALLHGDGPAWDSLLALGFDGERLAPLRDKLDEFVALLFAPFRSSEAVHVDGAMRKAKVEELLGEHRMVPRLAAPTSTIPAIRTLSGLLSVLGHLDAPMELGIDGYV